MKFYQTSILNKFPSINYYFTNKENGNLAFHVDDVYEDVCVNHQELSLKLNYHVNKLIHMKQIHSDEVHIVSDDDNFDTPPTCDALITNKKNTPLMVMVADCTPILFYDNQKKVIAVAHVGRAGAFKNIIKNVIDSFLTNFNSNVDNISVVLGASICSDCYEVGAEIYDKAKKLNLEFSLSAKRSKYHLDIRKILKEQLLSLKIQSKNIEISSECPSCLHNKYFSYRYEKNTGRFCGVIYLT